MLNAMQCHVYEVNNGQEAIEIIRHQNFDLVLMDCEMPILDGYAATRKIREWESSIPDHEHLPIVALTAHVLPEDRNRCLDSGMDDYLSKPFSMDELRTLLAQWLPITGTTTQSDDFHDGHEAPDEVTNNAVRLNALESIGDLDPTHSKELANRIISVYRDNSAELIAVIAEALNNDNREIIRTTAHALKSSSGNVGADRLVKMCRHMEVTAHENELEDMLNQLTIVKEEHLQVLDALTEWSQG